MTERTLEKSYCKKCQTFSLCRVTVITATASQGGGRSWRTWWEASKLVLLLISFFVTGVAVGFGIEVWREFTR